MWSMVIVFHTPRSQTVNPRASMNIRHTLHCQRDSMPPSRHSQCYSRRKSMKSSRATKPITLTTLASPILLHIQGMSRLLSSAPRLMAMKFTIWVANGPMYSNSLKKMAWYLTHKLSNWSRNLCANTPINTGLKKPVPNLLENLSSTLPFFPPKSSC